MPIVATAAASSGALSSGAEVEVPIVATAAATSSGVLSSGAEVEVPMVATAAASSGAPPWAELAGPASSSSSAAHALNRRGSLHVMGCNFGVSALGFFMVQGSLRLVLALTIEVPRAKKRPKAPWHVLITLSWFLLSIAVLTLDHLWENVERKGTLHTWTRGETRCEGQGSLACIDSHSRTHVFFVVDCSLTLDPLIKVCGKTCKEAAPRSSSPDYNAAFDSLARQSPRRPADETTSGIYMRLMIVAVGWY